MTHCTDWQVLGDLEVTVPTHQPCPPDPTWSQPPYAVHNGLLAAAAAHLFFNTGRLGTIAAGVGAWYFFSGKWWK